MPRPAMPHHLESLHVRHIVHVMFMAFLIMISFAVLYHDPL